MATTWNPSDRNGGLTLSNGNLTGAANLNQYASVRATAYKGSGKWYWECKIEGQNGGIPGVGIATVDASVNNYIGADQYGWCWVNSGSVYNNAGTIASIASYATNDVLGLAFDGDAHTVKFYKNNTLAGTISSIANAAIYPALTVHNVGYDQVTVNFGATSFTYTPPSGYSGIDTPPGWAGKIISIVPGKVMTMVKASIAKIMTK